MLDEILIKHPEMDFVQLQINYVDWNSPVICARECYEIARKHNKPIFVMEPIKGGTLVNKEIYLNSDEINKEVDLVEVALEFVKSLSGIHIILSGMSDINHVIQNRKILKNEGKNYSQETIKILRKKIENINKISCTSCKYCMEECPKGIPIPQILLLLNSCANIGGIRQTYQYQKRVYHDYVDGKGMAGSCINCGKCETLCPQKLPIRENLKEAVKLFEKPPTEVKLNRMTHGYRVLRDWMNISQSGNTMESFFKEKGYTYIAVYGIGEIGTLFLKELQRYESVQIKYGIDKKVKGFVEHILVIEPEDELKDVDVIIVTPTFDFENIRKNLINKVSCPIISLDEITSWCIKQSKP